MFEASAFLNGTPVSHFDYSLPRATNHEVAGIHAPSYSDVSNLARQKLLQSRTHTLSDKQGFSLLAEKMVKS